MKNDDIPTSKLVVPHFETEADEAQWWFDNQELIAQEFEKAWKNGTLRRSTLAERLKRSREVQASMATLQSGGLAQPMPTRVVDTTNTEHYKWGGPDATDCDGWHLVKTDDLSVIEELMPPGTKEERHRHARSRQFFFVLEGELSLEVEDHDFVITAGKGVEVHPGQAHQAANRSGASVRIVVTSQPPSHGDRIPA